MLADRWWLRLSWLGLAGWLPLPAVLARESASWSETTDSRSFSLRLPLGGRMTEQAKASEMDFKMLDRSLRDKVAGDNKQTFSVQHHDMPS